jgi:transposase
MTDAARMTCKRCSQLEKRLDKLEAELAATRAQLAETERRLAQARKTSATSSKPPSSDIVKPPGSAAKSEGKRSIGGQPGHEQHLRPLLPPEQLTEAPHIHALDSCPSCGHDLEPGRLVPRVVQQIDLVEIPLSVVEHRSLAGWCPQCQRHHFAPLPSAIAVGGLVGPRLTTLIAYLKGMCHASFSTIRKFLRDVVGVTISRGQLRKVLGKVAEALAPCYEQLYSELSQQAVLNVDETGHKENGQRLWTWCFRAELFTVFKIDPLRSGAVLLEVLGKEYAGVLGCDYFSAYRRYMRECNVVVQFCLAHLIRDIKFLTTLPDPRDRAYGERLRAAVRELFAVIHRRDNMNPTLFDACLVMAREAVLQAALTKVPTTRHSHNLAQRFRKHGADYFRFITTPGVEPTNNLAEQAIRFVVIDRHITQGTRSEGGRRWCERIWTVIATCSQRGWSVFEFLSNVVTTYFNKQPSPALQGT